MKPNIVFISADQLSAKWLEILIGAGLAPNLKKIRDGGLNFTHAFVNNPICMPSRSSTITGKPTVCHEVWNNDSKSLNPLRFACFPQILQENGYQTGGFGKFHFEPFWDGACKGAADFGFMESAVSEDMRYGPWLDWVREKSPEHYEVALSTVWHWHIPEFDRKHNAKELRRKIMAAAQKHLEPWREANGCDCYAYPELLPAELSQTSYIAERSCDFIKRHEGKGDPFFLYSSFVAPHMPCVPPREYLERIPDSIIPDPIPEPDLFPAPVARRRNSTYPLAKYTLDQWRRARRYYLAYVLQIDDAVGRMLDLVDPRNTYVLFSADHGDMLGDHGLWEKGAWHYDACVRVPMFLSGSGVEPAEREDIVSNLDISTTVLNMAGVENAREGTLLKRNSRTDMFIESYGMCTPGFADLNSPDTWCFTLRSKEYRYSWYPYGRAEQYFDLVDDPDERNDLSGSPGHAEKIKTLRASLKERLYWLGGL